MPGEQMGERRDELAEDDRAEPGSAAHQQGQGDQAALRFTEPRDQKASACLDWYLSTADRGVHC
ncbi:hypothetical protein GCM10009527_072420 [Actinomadura nitritigenes]